MSAQLELHLNSKREPARARLRRGLRECARRTGAAGKWIGEWSPLWVPALLALQIALLGLFPVVRESIRLDGDERVVRAREAGLLSESQTIEQERLMLEDPTWRERVLKSRQKLDGRPLTTEQALAAEASARDGS
jgi:hypothetical protein